MAAQMKSFIDQTGNLWAKDKLVGKVGSVFTATASQHGGQETTLVSFHVVLMHLGFIIIGLPYTFKGQLGVTQVEGISPYGASTVVGVNGTRLPSRVELEAARFQGCHVTRLAGRVVGGMRQTNEAARAAAA
jgi:NAD(P)H dehydrogenase (quinone)